MNKDMKIVHNFLQCLLCNSSRFHYLEPLGKGVIAKMAYLVEFWLILESKLVESSLHRIFVLWRNCIKDIEENCVLFSYLYSLQVHSYYYFKLGLLTNPKLVM